MADPTAEPLSSDLPRFVVKDPVKDAESRSKNEFTNRAASNNELAVPDGNHSFDEDNESHAPSDVEAESDAGASSTLDNLTPEEAENLRVEAMATKEEGNAAFRDGLNEKAVDLYSSALSKCSRTVFAKDCAALYSNRAAAKLKMKMYTAAVQDCNKSIGLDPRFTRAYFRRATAYEAQEKYEEATKDYQEVFKLDSSVREAGDALQRLPKLIEERNERLKTEMFGKLKQLGNSILRPFGMSVNNFKLEQGAEGGGYSVKYDPNAKIDADK